MKKLSFKLAGMSLLTSLLMTTLLAKAETLTSAKAAELTCHRIERLVSLKKLNENFLTKLQTLNIEALPSGDPSKVSFQIQSAQVRGGTGPDNVVQFSLDLNGKVLPNEKILSEGPVADKAPVWTDKDPVSLLENSLHYILEEGPKDPKLLPFLKSLKKVSLQQILDASNKPQARVDFWNTENTQALTLILSLKGDIIKSAVHVQEDLN